MRWLERSTTMHYRVKPRKDPEQKAQWVLQASSNQHWFKVSEGNRHQPQASWHPLVLYLVTFWVPTWVCTLPTWGRPSRRQDSIKGKFSEEAGNGRAPSAQTSMVWSENMASIRATSVSTSTWRVSASISCTKWTSLNGSSKTSTFPETMLALCT